MDSNDDTRHIFSDSDVDIRSSSQVLKHYQIELQLVSGIAIRSGATGGLGRNGPPTPHKGHFCKSPKTDEKKLGVWGEGDVTNYI